MFKVGDKVKIANCTNPSYTGYIGAEGVIEAIEGIEYKVHIDDMDISDWFFKNNLELIKPTKENPTISKTETVEKHKFKIGDRIRVKTGDCHDDYIGKEGIIETIDNADEDIPYYVCFENNTNFWFREDSIELIEPATTSETETVEKEVISEMETITPITPKCSFCELNQNLYSLDDYYSVKLDDNGIVELYQSCRLENIFAFDYCPCCGRKLKRFNRED